MSSSQSFFNDERRIDAAGGGPCSDSDLGAKLDAARSRIMKTNLEIQKCGQRTSRNEGKIAKIEKDVAHLKRTTSRPMLLVALLGTLLALWIGYGIAILAPTLPTCTATLEGLEQDFKRYIAHMSSLSNFTDDQLVTLFARLVHVWIVIGIGIVAATVPASERRSDAAAGGPERCLDSDLGAKLDAARSMIMKTNKDIQEYGQRLRNEGKIARLRETATEIEEDVAADNCQNTTEDAAIAKELMAELIAA